MKLEFDAITGQVIEREFTPEELAQAEIDRQEKEMRFAKLATQIAQRQAILDRLGLTEEEAQLLLGGN